MMQNSSTVIGNISDILVNNSTTTTFLNKILSESNPSTARYWFAFTSVYALELVKVVLGPVVSSVLVSVYKSTVTPTYAYISEMIQSLTPPKKVYKPYRKGSTLADNDDDSSQQQTSKRVAKTAKEDQKAYKGTSRDIDRLKHHGYDKYRFVSKSFVKRNGLKKTS